MPISQENIKVIVSYSRDSNLEEIVKTLKEDFPFLESMEILTECQILVTMDSIVDLLDVDFCNSYGATQTQLINPSQSTESVKYRLENFNSTQFGSEAYTQEDQLQQIDSILEELRPCFEQEEVPLRIERLTSLEDEVVEEEKLREKFLLDLSSQGDIFNHPIEEEVEEPDTLEEMMERDQETKQKKKQKLGWTPIFNGLAFTALIVGGIKAAKMFLH